MITDNGTKPYGHDRVFLRSVIHLHYTSILNFVGFIFEFFLYLWIEWAGECILCSFCVSIKLCLPVHLSLNFNHANSFWSIKGTVFIISLCILKVEHFQVSGNANVYFLVTLTLSLWPWMTPGRVMAFQIHILFRDKAKNVRSVQQFTNKIQIWGRYANL